MSKTPLLILALQKTSTSSRYKALIWILTFCVYCSYHLSRKPITVVKNALHQRCPLINRSQMDTDKLVLYNVSDSSCLASWPPFDNDNTYESYFGALDVSYLVAYGCGMFISGYVAERMNLRYFLVAGMTLSGLLTCAFGFGYLWQIHSLAYFIIVQIACGIFQSTGWPSVISIMGNWFGKSRRGLIMGVWNSHIYVGNILGGLIGSAFLTTYWSQYGYWSWSFIFPGIIIFSVAVIVFFLLVPHPKDVGLPPAESNRGKLKSTNHSNRAENLETSHLVKDLTDNYSSSSVLSSTDKLTSEESSDQTQAITFFGAFKVPGVLEYALCLCFIKLVNRTFTYWLPQYIKEVMTSNVYMTDPDATAGDLATMLDIGGIFGSIAAGYIADIFGSSSITCGFFLILSIPTMVLYREFGAYSYPNAIGLLLLTGFMVTAPNSLISTSVSADLGTHPSLSTNTKALAVIAAIIDGTGCLGSAAGPGLTAIIEGIFPHPTDAQENYKLNLVFGTLIGSNIIALLLLSRLIYKDVYLLIHRKYEREMNGVTM